MSSGLVLRTLLPEDASAFTPLKPVTMSGEPGEDTPVFEDIKPPTRSLENPPDLAQVRWRPAVCRGAAGRGQLRPLRCTEAANASCKRKCGFSLNSALFFRSLLKHLCRFVRSCFPLCRIFFWACWVSFFFFFFPLAFLRNALSPVLEEILGLARSLQPGLGSSPPGPAGEGVPRGSVPPPARWERRGQRDCCVCV